MPENRKSVVVDIVSDSKKFLSGFEEAIKEIEKVAKKADILGSMQDDIDELKQSIVSISKAISNIKPTTDDSAIQKLQDKMESLDNSIKYLKQNIKEIKFDVDTSSGKNIEKQTNSIKNEVSELISQVREASSFITELFNIKGSITSNNINNASSDLETYNKKLNELKSIQKSLKAKDTTIYSKMNFKEAEEELDRYKDKYTELELEISRLNSKIKSSNLQDNEKAIVTKDLNNYKIELASISREIIDIQDRLTESKTFKGEFFNVTELQSNINVAEKILNSRITAITNRITALSNETNSVISTNTFELKNGKINIPVELDKTATKLKNLLQEILSELQATVNPVTVPIQLVSAYKTNTKKEVSELKEIKALQAGIDQLTDDSQKSIAQSTLDKIKTQFQKELRIDIKTNISEAEKDINRGISKIKKILKDSGITIYPIIELNDENKKKFQEKLQELSKILSNDFGSDLTSLREEIEKLTNEDSLNNWGSKFISILDQISTRIDKFNGNLKHNNLYETLKGWNDANTILRNHRITKMHDDGNTDGVSGTGELERYMFLNTKTGTTSNSYIYDQLGGVSSEIINELIKLEGGLEKYNTSIHTHPIEHAKWKEAGYKEIGSNLSFSEKDIMSYQEYLKQGINKFMVLSNGKINELDLSSVDKKIVDKILKEYIKTISTRNTNDPQYYKQFINGKTVDYDIASKIDNDAFAKIIAKYTKQDASNYLKQYDVDSLKNISELSQEAQALEKVIDLLSKMSSALLSINNTGIQLDIGSFDKVKLSLDKINLSLENMISLIQRATGVSSDLEIDNQFEKVRNKFYEIANIDGSFDARKREVKELISEYQKYLDMGGKQPISDLTENEKSKKKLLELLNKQIQAQNELQQVDSKQSSSDLKTNQEVKEISNLSNIIDDVVKKINDKTEAFKQEQKVVSSTIPDETEKIGKLVSALTNVKKILEDISISSKGLDLSNLSNLGQLNKLKADKINTISTSIRSLAEGVNGLDIKDGNILNSLQDILNKANELKDLASILKSTTSQINAVKGNTKTQSAQNLLTGSEDTIRDLGILNLENQNLTTLSTSLKATSKGTVELIALVQDLKGNFQEYTLSTTNGVDFTTLKVEEGTNSVEKQALTWKKLHEIISQQPNNISMDFIDETSELWKDVSNAAENYKNELGEIVSITRSIRQDKDGNALESFKIMGSSGNSVTIGAELESVALKQRIDNGSYEKITKHNQDIIAAYKERNKQTKEYYELLEKVKSGTSTPTEIEQLNQIIEKWDKAINKKDEYFIQTGGDSKVEADAKKIQDEFINSQSLTYSSMVDKYVQSAQTLLGKLGQYNFTDDFQVKINEASKIINNLKLPLDLINDQESIKDVGLLKNLMSEINNGWKVDSNRISNETAFYKLQGKIADTLKENSAMSSKLKNDFRELQQEMEKWGSSIPNDELKKLSNRFFELHTKMKKAGETGRSFFDMVTNKAKHMSSAFIGQYLSLYDFVRYAQQAYQYVADIDKQMIELEKVSDMSASRLAESFEHAKDTAKDLGSTVSDVIAATADWSRLGYDADAAEQLAEVATIYKNVGDGIDISTANESLISTLQGFEMEASQAMEIVNSFNEVANRMPIDSAGIGEALQRSAAAFNAANTSLSESISLITATNAVIQDPTSVGTMWKTVSARIRGAKTELEEMGEDTEGMVESTSKLRNLVKGMTGFDIMEDEDTFKSIYDIMVGIGEEWENLSDIDQAALLEALAGKRAGNALAAALQNVDMIKEAYQIAENSSGSAMREQEKWEQGLEARTNKLKASLETLSTTLLDSDFLGGAIDVARGFIDVLTKIIDKFGILQTLLVGGGGIFAAMKTFKGEGK